MIARQVALVDLPRRLVREQARRLVRDRHLGEHELDRLVLRDRHAERLALERVRAALLERAPDQAGRASPRSTGASDRTSSSRP